MELAEEKYYVTLSMVSMNGTEYNVIVKNDFDDFTPIIRLGDITFKNNDSALCFDSMSRDNLRKNVEKDSSAEKIQYHASLHHGLLQALRSRRVLFALI